MEFSHKSVLLEECIQALNIRPEGIYLQTRALYPLQVILKEILTESDSSSLTYDPELAKYSDLVEYCTIVVAILPIFCFYPFILKYFTKGMMVGSLKG